MAQYNVAPLENLVDQFEKMPGIGAKTAQRLAYFVLNLPKSQAEEFANAIMDAHTKIKYCKVCCNLTDQELCPVCRNVARDKSVICVVETPRDATALENTHEFKGVYHVLHGAISPLNDVGPDQLSIKELLARVGSDSPVKEVIMATKSLSIRIEEEMLDKLHVIADYEGRSANGQVMYLLQKCIREFEKNEGEIKLPEEI